MPPKSKRPLKEGSGNQGPASKRRAKGKAAADTDGPAEASSSATASQPVQPDSNSPRQPRIKKGPNGEEFLPTLVPPRFQGPIDQWKVVLPMSLVGNLDGSDDLSMTLGSRVWWESHKKWLKENGKALGITAADERRRDEVLNKPYEPVEEGMGTLDKDYVCIPRPASEAFYDKKEKKGKKGKKGGDEDHPPWFDLASRHPDYLWITTVLGHDRRAWWLQETRRRDPEEFGYYEYSHSRHYGSMEVMENMIRAFNKAMNAYKKKKSALAVWSEIEGMVMFIDSDDCDFDETDDGEGAQRMIGFVGTMLVAAAQLLVREEKFRPDSEIKNLGLMLALSLRWAKTMNDTTLDYEEMSWAAYMRDLAVEHGVTITGPGGMERVFEEVDKMAEKRSASNKKRWEKQLNWDKEFKTMKEHMIPLGRGVENSVWNEHYDKTRATPSQIKRWQKKGPSGGLHFSTGDGEIMSDEEDDEEGSFDDEDSSGSE